MNSLTKYCDSLTNYNRWKTRVVNIGDIPVGGDYPVRVQSMTTTNTMDTLLTVEQSIRMIDAGCEYVRITAPSLKEAKNLAQIKKMLIKRGYNTPIIADIHFTPNAAIEAARLVEKVRINPGNFADRKKFQEHNYTDKSYTEELDRIYNKFLPLVKICKEEGCAMRIGANHGSLSDRILSRYGDTPKGMVESAMEFVRICHENNFHQIVLSMKASNTRVMVQAYRLLVNQMISEDMNYPLHLGVTEAGEGEDGRIKSSVGIGTLLEDGLGDTIRVSLTEEPELEIPVAKSLISRYSDRHRHGHIERISTYPLSPFEYKKRETIQINNIGGNNVPRVISDLSGIEKINRDALCSVGYKYFSIDDKWGIGDFACDYIYIGNKNIDFALPGTLNVIQDYSIWSNCKKENYFPFINIDEFLNNSLFSSHLNFLNISIKQLNEALIEKIKDYHNFVFVINSDNLHSMAEKRRFIIKLINLKNKLPVIAFQSYSDQLSIEELQLVASTDLGALLIDGIIDGVFMKKGRFTSLNAINLTCFGILQASRTRISKTEYISCPSCGRTLFDLQKTTALVRSRTNHLKGIKIGIMGCIVNGPGEMADADYGYVGTGENKISLYRGQDVVLSNIPSNDALDKLINLMKEDNVWVEPEVLEVG